MATRDRESCSRIARNPQILQRLTELLTPFVVQLEHGPSWPSHSCFLGSARSDILVASLLDEFSEGELMKTGLFELAESGSLDFIGDLREEASPVIFLREGRDELPFTVVSRECVGTEGNIAVEDFLRDCGTQMMLSSTDGLLMLTPTIKQAAVLRALGMAAAPIIGIAELSPQRRSQLKKTLLRVPRPSPQKGEEQNSRKERSATPANTNGHETGDWLEVTLVLAGWNPIEWSADDDAQVRAFAQFLDDCRRVLGVDFGDVGCWLPSQRDKDDIAFAMRHGNCASPWYTIRRSIKASCYGLEAVADPAFSPQDSPSNLVDAYENLAIRSKASRAIGRPSAHLAAAAEQFQAIAERELVQPLLKRGLAMTNPMDRVLIACAAENVRILSLQFPNLYNKLAAYSQGQMSEENTKLLFAELQHRCRTNSDLIRLAKALNR